MPSKSRQRHLAKTAERRRFERDRAARRRKIALGVGGAIAGILIVVLGIALLNRNGSSSSAGAGATPAASATPPHTATKPPKKTGNVTAPTEPTGPLARGAGGPAPGFAPQAPVD